MLGRSLLTRMHSDLLEPDEDDESSRRKKWIALPKTIRVSTRPRPPPNADGTRARTFNRISRSGPLPGFVFNLRDSIDSIVEKLVQETLIPMFRRLHPQQSGWNLSLMNIGVTNMIETASEDGRGTGRDISRMFKRQEDVLKEWKIEDRDMPPDPVPEGNAHDELGHTDSNQAEPSAGSEATDSIMAGSEDSIHLTQNTIDDQGQWEDNEDEMEGQGRCADCGIIMPEFAMTAHQLFHSLGE